MSIELTGPATCSATTRCATLQYAIDEGYLSVPIVLRVAPVELTVRAPALSGPPLSPRSRKHKPMLMLNYCPFCAYCFGAVAQAAREDDVLADPTPPHTPITTATSVVARLTPEQLDALNKPDAPPIVDVTSDAWWGNDARKDTP